MRSTLLPLAALFLFASTGRADDAADARAIVEKAIKAKGEKLDSKLTAMTWKDKGKFTGGDFNVDYTLDSAFEAPDKYRFDMMLDVGGMKITFIVVVNGGKAWESAMGMTREMSEEKLAFSINQGYRLNVSSLFPLVADKEFKLATAGEKDVNGKKAVAVTVTRDKRPTVTLYFDKESGLLVKTEMKVKDEFQGWKEVLDESFFSDYKEKDGKKFFTKMKVVRDGKTMIESSQSDQKPAEKLDAKMFEKPE